MKEMKNGYIRTTIYLPKELHKEFKTFCIAKESNVSQTLIKTISEMVSTKPAEVYYEKKDNQTM